jgi:hypothetical protein
MDNNQGSFTPNKHKLCLLCAGKLGARGSDQHCRTCTLPQHHVPLVRHRTAEWPPPLLLIGQLSAANYCLRPSSSVSTAGQAGYKFTSTVITTSRWTLSQPAAHAMPNVAMPFRCKDDLFRVHRKGLQVVAGALWQYLTEEAFEPIRRKYWPNEKQQGENK